VLHARYKSLRRISSPKTNPHRKVHNDNKTPSVILFSACSFMRYWAGLHSAEAQEMINSGVDLMAKTAAKILGRMKDDRLTPALTAADHGGGVAADDPGA
jgi:hypothetical protein